MIHSYELNYEFTTDLTGTTRQLPYHGELINVEKRYTH